MPLTDQSKNQPLVSPITNIIDEVKIVSLINQYNAQSKGIVDSTTNVNKSDSNCIFSMNVFTTLLDILHRLNNFEDQLTTLANDQSNERLSYQEYEQRLDEITKNLESQRQSLEGLIKGQQQFSATK